jgi:hypothetical protein
MTKWLRIGVVPMFSLVTLFAQLDPQLEYEVIRPSSKVEFFVGASLGDIHGVFASYHWLDDLGNPIDWDGLRAPLPALAPGEEATAELEIRAVMP